jgi:hypothetical protein
VLAGDPGKNDEGNMISTIQVALNKLEEARKNLVKILREEQKKCKHEKIIHSNWRSSEWGSAFRARRLCLACGMEEEARNSGWGNHDCDFPILKSNGFHKIVDADELYRARLPEVPVDTK